MRFFQRNPVARGVTAAILVLPVAALAWAQGWQIASGVVFVGVGALIFAALTIAPDAIALHRDTTGAGGGARTMTTVHSGRVRAFRADRNDEEWGSGRA